MRTRSALPCCCLILGACVTERQAATRSYADATPRITYDSGLIVEDIVPGDGPACPPGATVTVHYTGSLEDGTVFDATRPAGDHRGRGRPMTYDLDDLMPGWRQGVPGLRTGGTRRLTIPPALAYGEYGREGRIPPGATLVYVVELLSFEPR